MSYVPPKGKVPVNERFKPNLCIIEEVNESTNLTGVTGVARVQNKVTPVLPPVKLKAEEAPPAKPK